MTGTSAEDAVGIVVLNTFILLIGVALDVVGMLLWARKIPYNSWIGIRISSMGSSKDIWYEVNEFAGKIICFDGLFLVCYALLYFILPLSFSFLARILLFLAVFVISLVATLYICINRAKVFASPSLRNQNFGAFEL